MSSVASATSLFLASQALTREQTMATFGLKQEAKEGEAIVAMLEGASQASQAASPPPGQGIAVDLHV